MTDLIAAHLAHITAAGLSPRTVADRTDLLRRLDHDLPMGLEQATVEELTDWLARPGWSASTRATYRAHLVAFFDWACNPAHPILDWNPARSLARPRVPARLPRPVTDDELAHALAHAREPWRRLVLLAAYAGLRCCELATVRRENIAEDDMIVTGKGGRQRLVGTHPAVWTAVHSLPPGPLAGGLGARAVSRGVRREMARIGLTGPPLVSAHRFRHWFGTCAQREYRDLRVTQELMGHASPISTAGYAAVTNEQRRLAVRTLPVLPPASA